MTGADDPADAQWRWWRERRLPAERIHLDSAAAGRSSRATLAATAAHAEREATTGAYVAAAEAEPVLAEGRAGLARLLGVPAAGVTFVPSAEAALDALLAIWPLGAGNKQGDAVAVVPCEWGPNLHAFAARGLRITEIATHGDGAVDLAALERMLAGRPARLRPPDPGHLAPRPGAAGRRGGGAVPRGGRAALGGRRPGPRARGHRVRRRRHLRHQPQVAHRPARRGRDRGGRALVGPAEDQRPDLVEAVRPADSSPLWLVGAGEANVAAWVGLCTAVAEHLEACPARVWDRLAAVGRQTRETLAGLPGWAVADAVDAPSAIVALRATNGQDVAATRARLLAEHGIVTTAGAVTRAPRDMTEPLLRVSPHLDCTPGDLDRLRQALLALG